MRVFWKSSFFLLIIFALWTPTLAWEYSIDNTCQDCDRRYLDSLNVYNRRNVRINQTGYRPQDYKRAMVANATGNSFKIINAENGSEAYSGNLKNLGKVVRPGMWINGAFNSITTVYEFEVAESEETLFEAVFSDLNTPGQYYLVAGNDTSATFRIDDKIFNYIFENALKFFGVNRCGDTHSWIHGPCHLMDGADIGKPGALAGGWHDCGDHFKVSETLGYTALMLSMTYALWPEKAEDFYGASYNDTLPFGTDGIPDLLWESKVGADYIFKLYKASVEDGLLAQNDMYHSVGVAMADHHYWDMPERQDVQPAARGGNPRVVAKGIGGNVAGMYTAALAFFAWGWEPFDKPYADSILAAAEDMYAKLVIPLIGKNTDNLEGFYTGAGQMHDDPAMAAVALWFATKKKEYGYDLLENPQLGSAPNAVYNQGVFPLGLFGREPFHHGGWMTDYQQVNALAMYAFAKLIVPNNAKAAEYGIEPVVRDSLMQDAVENLRASVEIGSNGSERITTASGGIINADFPYYGVFTSADWGFNRYNMGLVIELFMMWDLTGDKEYLQVGLDNFYYNLGMNPWDISFFMAAGDKNLQHPHNRAANPDGYNAGGFPYEYTSPKGALMGGCHPEDLLKDDWNDYTVTETCIDFSSQIVLPAQMLAKDLPPDNEGPKFTNVQGIPVSESTALISWETDELAQVTVYLADAPFGNMLDTLHTTGLSMAEALLAENLELGKTYYFYLEGMDIRKNRSSDDNHGEWYSFTMVLDPAQISGVRICQVDDRSAKVYWWTANGAYPGILNYGSNAANLNLSAVGDQGRPVMFHEVLLKDLEPATTYYFDVVSGSTTDNNGGAHYQFTTTALPQFVDYTITLKPINKSNGGAHFYMEIMNNEDRPYTGLEIRFYYSTKSVAASNVEIKGFDNQIFDVGGMTSMVNPTFGAPVQVQGTNQWYIPITIPAELPVSGRARLELVFYTNGWDHLPWAEITESWSIIPHTDPGEPQYFPGIDLAKGLIYAEPEHVESVNGVPEVTYVRDPYVSAHFNGNHIYGYPPDYADGKMPVIIRDMYMTFSSPFVSPQINLVTEEYEAAFTGTSWVKPTGNLDLVELNGQPINVEYPTQRKDSLTFNRDVSPLNYGNNRYEFVTWHNANANESTDLTKKYDCQCVYQRSNIEVDTVVVPRIQRYVNFIPADTVHFYQGKRTLVRLQLTDSLGNPVSDVDISLKLAASIDGVDFYGDAMGRLPISRIVVQNGVAEFYVAFEGKRADDVYANLSLSPENPPSEYMFIIENPVLFIEAPPPWPIIESAVILDTDCDFIPDVLEITMSTEMVPGTYELVDVSFFLEGEKIKVAGSLAQVDGKIIRASFNSPSGKINTHATGEVEVKVNAGSIGEKTSTDFYSDGIGPVVLSVSLLENVENTPHDSLFVQFSEAVHAQKSWPFNVYDLQGHLINGNVEVLDAKLYNEKENIWVYNIINPSGGANMVDTNTFVQLLPGAEVVDEYDNGVAACDYDKIKVGFKRRPVPMTFASISDKNDDGLAETIRIEFIRPVDDLHEADSIAVVFGYFAPETLTVSTWTWNNTRDEATLNLKPPFAQGITAGTFEGVHKGSELVNAGMVIQYKGAGADFDSQELVAQDSVGPMIIAAHFGEGRAFDTLIVNFSEPVVSRIDTANFYHLIRQNGDVPLEPSFYFVAGDGLSLLLFYTSEAEGYVTEGDRVRMAGRQSRYYDESGNYPAENGPWVTVTGKRQIKVEMTIANKNNVNKVDPNAVNYGPFKPENDESMRITIVNPRNGSKDIWKDGQVLGTVNDTNAYKHTGPTFLLEIDVPTGKAYGEAPIWDLVEIDLNLSVFSNLGAFVNKISEKILLTSAEYLDTGSKLLVQIEWLVDEQSGGVKSQNGRAAGSGAYVAQANMTSKMYASIREGVSAEQMLRFNNKKSNQNKNILFGYVRSK